MKKIKILLSTMLVVAVLMSMVLSANAYTYKPADGDATEKTVGSAGHTYVYDWKDSSGAQIDKSVLVGHQSLGSYKHSTDSSGVDRFNFQPNSSYLPKYDSDQGLFKAAVCNEMYIADDFSLGCTDTKFKAEAGHYYEISVLWTLWMTGELYLMQPYGGSTDFKGNSVGVPAEIIGGTNAKTTGNNATKITTTWWVDADKEYEILDTNGNKTTHIPAGRYFGLSASNNGEYMIYSVTVTVYDKEGFAAKSDNGVTLNFDNGLNDIYLPAGDGQGIGTIEIAEDPNNSGRGNTMKITTTRKDPSTFTFGLAAAPGLGTFKGKSDNIVPGVDGFKVTAGEKYYVSFDIYLENSDEEKSIGESFPCYVAGKSGVGQTGSKSAVSKSWHAGYNALGMQAVAGDGVWRHHEFIFTASPANASYEYLLLGLGHSGDTDGDGVVATVYFDNITVSKITKTPLTTFANNVKRSIRTESGSGDTYVSAGLRFRGEIPTATANAAAEVGFVVAPEAYVEGFAGEGAWYDMTSGAPALADAVVANATNKVYGVNGSNNQYQLILTKLTKEGADKSLKNTYFNVVMYVKATNGTYTYYNVGRSCYAEVANVYMNNGIK